MNRAGFASIDEEWSRFWHLPQLDLSLLQARFRSYGYTPHSHEYYVVAVVERGLQSFRLGSQKHLTPPDGLIFINPGEVHTGEAADEDGFRYLALYPTTEHMQTAAAEMGQANGLPHFQQPRVDDRDAAQLVRRLHHRLRSGSHSLADESHYLWTLTRLIKRFANGQPPRPAPGDERGAVRQARDYLRAHYDQPVSLNDLAAYSGLSRYHLLRVFHAATGMPPHRYQESLRIQQAQRLIAGGQPLAQVAQALGYSSQSHFTQRFKQHIGVTPGVYAQKLGS